MCLLWLVILVVDENGICVDLEDGEDGIVFGQVCVFYFVLGVDVCVYGGGFIVCFECVEVVEVCLKVFFFVVVV